MTSIIQLNLFDLTPASLLLGKSVRHNDRIGIIEDVLEWQNIDSWMTPERCKARHVKVSFPDTYMRGKKEIKYRFHMILRLDKLIIL